MAQRFCSRCSAHVEDAGGYCLLGHPLGDPSSLEHLRAEVDKAFDEARLEVAEALAAVTPPETTAPSATSAPVPAPVPIAPAPVPTPAPAKAAHVPAAAAPVTHRRPSTPAPAAPPAAARPPARMTAPPPPPPPPASQVESLMGDLATPADIENDPIASFAPPPRMDWGPERSSVLRNPFRRKATASA